MRGRKELRDALAGRVARRMRITGRVQGVGYRYFARTQAEALGVEGWVRNLADGRTLEVHVEGPQASVLEAVEWIGRGPASARVESVAVEEVAPAGASSFEIRA